VSRRRLRGDDPRVPQLIELYLSGLSIPQAARKLKLGCGSASKLLRDAGVEIRISRPWPAEKVDRLVTLRQMGWTWSRIAIDLDCSETVARHLYRRLDVTDLPTMPSHVVIGEASRRNVDTLAQRIAEEIERLGAVVLLQHRGRLVTAVPGSIVAQAAEEENAVVATYVEGVDQQWIAADLEEVCS
jgi:hypothetical protein